MENLSNNSYETSIKDKKREEFLEELIKRPDILSEFPIEKLEIIDKYYDELIAKKTVELNKLKKAN